MKTWNDLKAAVLKASSPEQAAGTFIDGYSSVIENNVNDPSNLRSFISDVRSGKQTLLHAITGGKSGNQ